MSTDGEASEVILDMFGIERKRRRLRLDKHLLPDTEYRPRPDYAPGYTVSRFAKVSTTSLWKCLILYALAWGKKDVLEFGTGFGFSAAYMAAAGARVHSFDADSDATRIARTVVPSTVTCTTMTCDEALDHITEQGSTLYDMAYIDSDHIGDSVVRYFEGMLPRLAYGAVVVFDDILWSRDMMYAWEYVSTHVEVKRSRKIHDFGIVWLKGMA